MVCIPDGGPAMDETKLGHCMPNASKLCPQSLLGTLGMGGPPSLAQNRVPCPLHSDPFYRPCCLRVPRSPQQNVQQCPQQTLCQGLVDNRGPDKVLRTEFDLCPCGDFAPPYSETGSIHAGLGLRAAGKLKHPVFYRIFSLVVVLGCNSLFLILSSLRRKTSPVQENHRNMLCFKGANFGRASEVSRFLVWSRILKGKERSTPFLHRGWDSCSPPFNSLQMPHS